VCWTPHWFHTLSSIDRSTLHTVVSSLLSSGPVTMRDVPVYLPDRSPCDAARLLILSLGAGWSIAAVCGAASGNLAEIAETVVDNFGDISQ
jgi:hypothetical protein